VSQYQNFTSAYMGTVVGAWCYLWCYCSVCLYVPNAELALMFIPVPIKAKIFRTRFSFSRFVFRSLRTIYFGGGIAHFAHVGGALFGFLIMWYWNQFNDNRWD
jgi:membrane associated rhomboid family serine protease